MKNVTLFFKMKPGHIITEQFLCFSLESQRLRRIITIYIFIDVLKFWHVVIGHMLLHRL